MSTTPAPGADLDQPAAATVLPSATAQTLASQANPAPPAAPIPQPPPLEDEEEFFEEPSHFGRFVLFNALPSTVISAFVHFVAFLLLALFTFSPPDKNETLAINALPAKAEQVEELAKETLDLQLDSEANEAQADVVQVLESVASTTTPTVAVDVDAAPLRVDFSDFGDRTAPKSDLMATVGAAASSGLSGRGDAERGTMIAQLGGTAESEAAVANALKWFVEHQNHDGSWSLDHRTGPCKGRCSEPGTYSECRTGATALALLPFLGAGQTHQQGQYKQVVERGIYFLTSQMKVKNQGGMQTGDMTQGLANDRGYSHPLAAITLCEAYAMTHDRKLMTPAQLAINHIVYAQDPIGGGWRYSPRMPGDTSVAGWQIMALKSGHMAYLAVPPSTIQGAIKFLDSTQAEEGARYGYTTPGRGEGTTSVGLLCRIYLGWKQDHPALKRGVEQMSSKGPMTVPLANMYYNYYATQVMRQYCGDPGTEGHEMWEKWNNKMRDWLVQNQEKAGHQKGSWYMRGDHGSVGGGRVYCTSMATMILEVYYRHMPIYGKQAATEDFPL
jgi:hypothetical protein